MPTCTQCGAEMPVGTDACPKCGKAVAMPSFFTDTSERDEQDGFDEPRSWIEKQFAETSTLLVFLVALFGCCVPVLLPLSLVGVLTCRDPTAKRNATIILVFHVIWAVLFLFMSVLPEMLRI